MTSMDDYDPHRLLDFSVLIVGAGPAGISTWLHLHKYAPEIADQAIVIDKAVFPRDKLCAGGVSAWGLDVLSNLDVELDIPSVFVSDIEFRFGKERYHFHEPNCTRVMQRIEFDNALVKTAVKRGLKFYEGEALVDITRDPGHVIVKTGKHAYRVKTIIGADGARSRVRRKTMPALKQHLSRTLQVFAPADPEYDREFDEKKIVCDFTPINEGLQGYVYHFPCLRDGIPAIAHGIGDVRIHRSKPRADLKEIFSRELRKRNLRHPTASWSSHPIRWLSETDIIARPNVILTGEAAGIDPALGGGITIALASGEVAARAVIAAFRNNDFSFNEYRASMMSHAVGRYINGCVDAARDMYGGNANPLAVVRNMFSSPRLSPDMIRQMLAGVVARLQAS